MRKTKRVYANYAFFDRTGIQTFLEKQALKGWMLCRKKASVWHFRRMEQKKLHYSVTYFPNGSESDTEPSEELKELMDFCEHTGWKQAVNGGAMQIFYHDAENPTPIETDALVELNTIHKAVKKEYLLPRIIWLLVYFLTLTLPIARMIMLPLVTLAQYKWLVYAIYAVSGILLYGFEIVQYNVWHKKARMAAEMDGSFVETRSYPLISIGLWVMCVAFLTLYGFEMQGGRIIGILLISLIVPLGLSMISNSISDDSEEDETPAKQYTSLISLMGKILLLGSILACGIALLCVFPISLDESKAVDTYTYNDKEYMIYADEIPLTIEDLMETDYTSYSYEEMNNHGTFLLEYYQASQQPRQDDPEQPQLRYRIVTVKADFLYDYCKNNMLDYLGDGEWIDSEPWGAEQVYYAHKTDSVTPNRYLLCYPNRIVELRMDWIPTPEQMTIIADAFD